MLRGKAEPQGLQGLWAARGMHTVSKTARWNGSHTRMAFYGDSFESVYIFK